MSMYKMSSCACMIVCIHINIHTTIYMHEMYWNYFGLCHIRESLDT